jgi:thiamine monophosphate kinase
MLQALTEPHARRDEAWSNLERAVSLCNVNATAEGDVMPHLFTAIFYGQPDAVQLLLKAGAKPDMQLSVPGKPVDGLNALQYAKRRLEKPENQANQQAYTEVVEMLQTHAAEPRAPKGTVP